jgi:hypothetical protein
MIFFGGRTRARTWDPLIKSQLSRFADLLVLASLFGVAGVVSAPSRAAWAVNGAPLGSLMTAL